MTAESPAAQEQQLIVLLEEARRLARDLDARLTCGPKVAAILASVLEELREQVQ